MRILLPLEIPVCSLLSLLLSLLSRSQKNPVEPARLELAASYSRIIRHHVYGALQHGMLDRVFLDYLVDRRSYLDSCIAK